jgi:nucleotide-binding universal stress UspA family protein
MERFQRLGIFLNDEPGDDEALAFAGRFAQLANVKSILCIHVRGVEQSASAPAPTAEQTRQMILKVLPQGVAQRVVVEVHEGTGIREILRSAVESDLDLIVVGRRLPHDQLAAGSAFTRLARKAPCSVLVVPDKARSHLGRVIALVDGSPHSKAALQVALSVARQCGDANPQVIAQSVFNVGYGHQYTGLSQAEAVRRMEEVERRRMEEFLSDVDTSGVAFELVLTCSNSVEHAAEDLASARNMDLIVLGSRGMTTAPASLIGSKAERILATCPLPVLIVKKKGETYRFIDALLSQT